MARFFAGTMATLLLMVAALFIWKARAGAVDVPALSATPPANAPAPLDPLDVAAPPQAGEATREARRFNRFDRNRDGAIAADEFLQTRRKAYAKLDTNGDDRLTFEEYAVKAFDKFRSSDRDRSGQLNASEFAATRPARAKSRPSRCAPSLRPVRSGGEDDG